jgi:ABC-type multidrug transport system ATPase subunit
MHAIVDHPTDCLTGPDASGAAVEVCHLSQRVQGRTTLHDVSFSVAAGEVVAIVGGSGAGKTTLLETMIGIRPPSGGAVRIAGAQGRADVSYVPQDDIIHRDLPLARTLRYAAQLRLPAGTPPEVVDRTVSETLAALDLAERANVRVGALSGGQRKRASIAVELLTRPAVFFLDEPTSGLDPATAREVLRLLRRLAADGTTIVLTTHSPTDIDLCDRIVFLARDGHLAFVGTPAEARQYFEATDLTVAYERLASEDTPAAWAERFAAVRGPAPSAPSPVACEVAGRRPAGGTAAPVGRAHPPQRRPAVPESADAGGAGGIAGAGRRHDGRAVPSRRVRRPDDRRGDPDDVLARVRRVLLRPHLRPAPDRRGDGRSSAGSGWPG